MNARYEQLVGRAPDGIVVHDGERIVEVNAALIQLAGASRADELVGQQVADLLSPPHLRVVEQALVAAFRGTSHSQTTNERLHRVDGRMCDVELNTQLFLDADRPAVHVVVRDLTERHALAKRQHAAAERRHFLAHMAAIRLLAGGVAHEVNNMLQIIIGYASVIQKETVTDSQALDLEEILRAAEYAASVTRQLAQFAGNDAHVAERVDLAAEVPRLYRDHRRLAGDQRPSVMEISEAVVVRVDQRHLRSALECVLANADRATRLRGDVQLDVRHQSIAEPRAAADHRIIPPGTYGVITVRDTGVGMSEETQRRVLEPFYTTHGVGQGAGLGLSACLGLLETNEGYLTFESALNEGSAFTLWFPVDHEQEHRAESEPDALRHRPEAQ